MVKTTNHKSTNGGSKCRNIFHRLFPAGWWFGTFVLFFHILGIIIPTDFHIHQMGRYTTNQKNIAPGRSPPFRYFVEEWNLDALIRYIKVEICGNYGLIILLMMVNGQYHIIVSLLMIMLMLITFNVMVISH